MTQEEEAALLLVPPSLQQQQEEGDDNSGGPTGNIAVFPATKASGTIPEGAEEERAKTWDTFLSDKPTEGETYVEPSNIEFELSKDKRQECREIVKEVKAFGISQRQTLFLIQLLAMELENFGAMKAIVRAVSDNRNNIPVKTTEASRPKIILVSPDRE